jgi:hypothetical protein
MVWLISRVALALGAFFQQFFRRAQLRGLCDT